MITSPDFMMIASNRNHSLKNSFFILRTSLSGRNYFTTLSVDPLQHITTIHEDTLVPYLASTQDACLFPAGFGLYAIFSLRSQEIRAGLWNPRTKEIKVLPPSPLHNSEHFRMHGFAQAEFKDGVFSYKVGLLYVREKVDDVRFFWLELFDSIAGTWKFLPFHGKYSIDSSYQYKSHPAGVNFRGVYHFRMHDLRWYSYIVTFDYTREVFGTMEVPVFPDKKGSYYVHDSLILTLYDDRFLCCVISWKKRSCTEYYLDVWIMREYGDSKSWTRQSTTGPLMDSMHILNYSESTGTIFIQETDGEKRLILSHHTSSAVTRLPINASSCRTKMQVLERSESHFSINGVSDEATTVKVDRIIRGNGQPVT